MDTEDLGEQPAEKLSEKISVGPTLPPDWRRSTARSSERTAADERLIQEHGLRGESDRTEIGLMRRAAPFVDAFGGRLPLERELKDIYEHFGIDLAQAVFAQAVERSPAYGAYVRRVRSFDLQAGVPNARDFEVTIVRSSLPAVEWGEHANEWRTWARSLGFTTDIIETREDDDLRENARAIARYLVSNPHPRRILVTYGQGAAEFRSLLTARFGLRGTGETPTDLGELASIHSWINVNGAFNGAAAARVENDSWFVKLKLEVSKYFGTAASRVRAGRWRSLDSRLPAFRAAPQFPAQMNVINVIGLPLKEDLPLKLLVPYTVISPEVGPNDGALSIYESIASPGLIVPVPRMSHAAEKLRLEPVLKRVLASIARDAASQV